jgi:thioesterase domain-containing protein
MELEPIVTRRDQLAMALYANRAKKATALGREARDATPLVCIDYEYLAGKFGADRPVICLLSMSLPPHIRTDVEAAARYFIDELKGTMAPDSAYYLSGYCYGGVVALEMARLLIAEGKRIGSLVLIEPPYPGARRPFRLSLMRTLLTFLRYPTTISLHLRPTIVRQLRWLMRRPSETRPPAGDDQGVPGDYGPSWVYRAAAAYSYPTYPGRFTFVFGERSRRRFFPTAGWRDVAAGGIDVRLISGGHNEVFNEDLVTFFRERQDSTDARASRK